MRRQINAALPSTARREQSRGQRLFKRARRSLIAATLTRGLDLGGFEVKLDHFGSSRIAYQPCDPIIAWRALRMVPRDARGTVVDFGCGRGLVLRLAADLRFDRVVGLEINEELAEAARANLRNHRRSECVRVVVADAADWPIPDDMGTAFLYCPFTGATFAAWLRRVLESLARHPRVLTIVYVYPFEERQLLESGAFRLIRRQRGGRADELALRVALFRHDPVAG